MLSWYLFKVYQKILVNDDWVKVKYPDIFELAPNNLIGMVIIQAYVPELDTAAAYRNSLTPSFFTTLYADSSPPDILSCTCDAAEANTISRWIGIDRDAISAPIPASCPLRHGDFTTTTTTTCRMRYCELCRAARALPTSLQYYFGEFGNQAKLRMTALQTCI